MSLRSAGSTRPRRGRSTTSTSRRQSASSLLASAASVRSSRACCAARRIKFTALDSNQTHVDFVRKFGNQVYYGDASRLDLLRAAGAETAKIFVLAIDDVDASVRTAELVRAQFPKLKIFARARNRQHAFALMDAGSPVHHPRDLRVEPGDGDVSPARARARRRRRREQWSAKFRQHDEATFEAQYAVKEDETKFIATHECGASSSRSCLRRTWSRPNRAPAWYDALTNG